MINRIALALIFVCLLASRAVPCGTERWQTKVLKDPGAAEIDFTPIPEVLHELILKPAPEGLRQAGPAVRYPEEKHVYSVRVLLIGYKREADGDYHLVIADPVDRRKTMIAEIPSVECASKKYSAQFSAAGAFIESVGHASPKFRRLPKPFQVTITGVFFFDFIHGQTGVAPNGAELHPVLSIHR